MLLPDTVISLALSSSLIFAVLTSVTWYLIVVWAFLHRHVNRLCFLFYNLSVLSFAHISVADLVFLLTSSSLHILDISPSVLDVVNFPTQSFTCSLPLSTGSLLNKKILSLYSIKKNLFYCLCPWESKKSFFNPRSSRYSINLKVLPFTLKLLIYLDSTFVYGIR